MGDVSQSEARSSGGGVADRLGSVRGGGKCEGWGGRHSVRYSPAGSGERFEGFSEGEKKGL